MINKLSKWIPRQAAFLQAAAVAVAAPRYMGAFAAALGIRLLDFYPWFAHIEIWSGAFMAFIEGWAIAFVFRHWRSMKPKSWPWSILLLLQLALMLALPFVAAPYLVSSQLNEPIRAILSPAWMWLWSLLVAAIAPLVLAAVGYVDREPAPKTIKSGTQAKQEPIISEPEPLICEMCGATAGNNGKPFFTQQALNAHKAHCPELVKIELSPNGK